MAVRLRMKRLCTYLPTYEASAKVKSSMGSDMMNAHLFSYGIFGYEHSGASRSRLRFANEKTLKSRCSSGGHFTWLDMARIESTWK